MKKPTKPAGTTIKNCTFTASAANWDPKQVEAVQTVARALLNLSEFFKNQGLTAPMVQIGHEGPCKPHG